TLHTPAPSATATEKERAGEPGTSLLQRAVAIEDGEGQPEVRAHACTPICRSGARICFSVLGWSTASGAGSRPAMLRIHAACRASTETMRAASRNASLPTLPACPL